MPVDLTYGLAEAAIAALPSVRRESAPFDPLGCGIVRPFRRDGRGDFANACGEVLVRSDLGQLLGTVLAEVPWRHNLGTLIYQLRHRANTGALSELARVQIEQAMRTWEPRAALLAATADPVQVGTENAVQLRIRYRIGNGEAREDTALI